MSSFDQQRLDRVAEFLTERYIAPGKLVGAQVAVRHHGEPVYAATLGMADRERGIALADDTIFRIYSMTKPLTSLAFMMLVEEGLVALDDPVHRFIPAWKGLGVFAAGTRTTGFATTPTGAPMRMVDLLRHTSGLTYGFQNRTNVDAAYRQLKIGEIEKAGDLDGFIAALATLPLEFSPATAWNYSVATDVLGYLVGKISGEPFEAFLRRRILDPLGMVDTGFHVRAGQGHRFAACYTPGKDGLALQDDPADSSFLNAPAFISGGGGLVSTTADYAAFAQMLLTGATASGERLVGRKTLELMTANHLPGGVDLPALSQSLFSEAAYDGVGFGLGFAVTTDPAKTLMPGSRGEFFWGGAASTFFWVDPAEALTCVFMTQLLPSSTYPVRRELRTLIYSALD